MPERWKVSLTVVAMMALRTIALPAAAGVPDVTQSFFVPQAYCRFGCPTGAVLNYVRTRGSTDRFARRDVVALLLVGLAVVLNWKYLPLIVWLKGLP